MSLANALKKAASKTLSKLGGDVTIRQVTAGTYNTTTGAITESTSDTTIKGVLDNVSRSEVNDLLSLKIRFLQYLLATSHLYRPQKTVLL